MKKKKYLKCIVTRQDNTIFENPLKLSEAYLISQLAQENKKINVTCEIVSSFLYNGLF